MCAYTITEMLVHVTHRKWAFETLSCACRAVVELQRAMQENSIARCPILSAQHDGGTASTSCQSPLHADAAVEILQALLELICVCTSLL